MALAAGLIAALPLLAAPEPPTVDNPEVWRQALALVKPAASEVALNARVMTGGAWFDVEDPGLGAAVALMFSNDGRALP